VIAVNTIYKRQISTQVNKGKKWIYFSLITCAERV
jgi:hypothetical protein